MILVILAGGKGLRLRPLTNNIPKPMVEINKRPFLEKLILNFSKYNLKKIFILTGYKYQKIHSVFDKKFYNGVEIICINERKIMGTGGALYQLKDKIKGNFFLINGDTFLDIDLNNLFSKINKKKIVNIFLTKKNINNNDTLNLDNKKNIIYDKKSIYISSGLYFFNSRFLKTIENKPSSLEKDILPIFIKKKKITGHIISSLFIDIGTKHDLGKFKKLDAKLKKAIFLDRDGVINYDKGYTYKIKDFKFKSKILNFIKKYKDNYIFFIVTNQSGIGRGYYSIKDFFLLHQHIKLKLYQKNIMISDLEFCPHYEKSKIKKFKVICKCRKPNNLMFKNLKKRWNINLKESFMIGDSKKDELFAKNSKIKFKYYSSIKI